MCFNGNNSIWSWESWTRNQLCPVARSSWPFLFLVCCFALRRETTVSSQVGKETSARVLLGSFMASTINSKLLYEPGDEDMSDYKSLKKEKSV